MTDDFPDDPRQRRLLVLVDEGRRDALEMSREGQVLLRDQSAQVVAFPLSDEVLAVSPVLAGLDRRGELDVGSVLVQHPLEPDQYVALEALSGEVALKKIRLTTELCRRLGASRVHVDEARAESESGQSEWSANASSEAVSGSVDWLNSELKSVMRAVSVHDEFPGGPADVESASSLLADHGLEADGALSELIDLRTGANPLRRRVIRIVTHDEIASAERFAAKVRAALPSVGVTVKRSAEELRTYVFTLTIEFPDD